MIAIIDAIRGFFIAEKRERSFLIFTSTGEPQGGTLIAELRRLGIK
jgi:hypothetical protein